MFVKYILFNPFKYFQEVACRFPVCHISPYPFKVRYNSSDSQSVKWESVVGLEIHAQINAKSKLFSSSASLFNAPTNSQVTYFDAALPGSMPILNRHCIDAGILTALALNCSINKVSTFDRKHYFYPDLPAGYQVTQQFQPLASNGQLKFCVYNTTQTDILYECCAYLKQIQLEQDSGKSFHIEGQRSLVDLNRAGIGLMELVFEPNLKNGSEAAALVRELILILRSIDVCTCDMEEGALRVDANISINRPGEPFGVKTEVKNINSVRFIAKAIDYEINRQIKILESGGFVSNETRAFDYSLRKTVFMRDKETLQDYRFMPEPNLPPIVLFDDSDSDMYGHEDIINIDDLKRKLPPLPSAKRNKLVKEYGISLEAAHRLLNLEGAHLAFEEAAAHVENKKILFDFLINNVQHQLNVRKLSFFNCPVTNKQIGDIVKIFEQRIISEATANDILEMLCNGDSRSAAEIVKEYNWYQINEGEELEKLCLQAMKDRPRMVKKYRSLGQRRYMQSLVAGLNLIASNRTCIKDAEKTFERLIGRGNGVSKGKNSESS